MEFNKGFTLKFAFDIIKKADNVVNSIFQGGEKMPSTNLEIAKTAIDDFKEIQEYMILAKEEHAEKTYAKLKKRYLTLKAILNVAGVNLTDIDEIKE